FAKADVSVVRSFVIILKSLEPLWEKSSLEDMIRASMRRVIARALAGARQDEPSKSLRATIAAVIVQYETWAEQTYEGRRISAAVGIDPAKLKANGVPIADVYREDFGAVLAGGLETFLTVTADGFIDTYEPLPTEAPKIT